MDGRIYRQKYYISLEFIIILIGIDVENQIDCRWWAVAIPSLAVITLVYIYAALQGYNLAVTPSFDRLECITGILFMDCVDKDSYSRITTEPTKDKSRGTNGVLDLPAGLVCEILYGQPDETEENGSI